MNKPHKHAELIKAWADGAEIEVQDIDGNWHHTYPYPGWDPKRKYRIKLSEKKKVTRWLWALKGASSTYVVTNQFYTEEEASRFGYDLHKKLEYTALECEE